MQDNGKLTVVVFPEAEYLNAMDLPSDYTWVSGCTRSSSGKDEQFRLNDLLCLAPYHLERRAAPIGWQESDIEELYAITGSHEWTHIVLDRVLPFVHPKNNYSAFYESMAELVPKIILSGLKKLPREATSFLLSLKPQDMVAWVDINREGLFVFDQNIPLFNRAYASCLFGGLSILDTFGSGDYRLGFDNLLTLMKDPLSQGVNSRFIPALLSIIGQRGLSFNNTQMAIEGQEVLKRIFSSE